MLVLYHRNFRKEFEKLSAKVQTRFYERIEVFVRDPFAPILKNHSVARVYPRSRSISITGDYRAIYQQESGGIVMFTRIGTHSELYG